MIDRSSPSSASDSKPLSAGAMLSGAASASAAPNPVVSSAAESSAAANSPKVSEQAEQENWKDVLQSVWVALILALIFRAFVIEAFVIPTGSMANTLMGRHYEVSCPRCGYGPWPLTIPKEDPQVPGAANRRLMAKYQPAPVCPNCNHHLTNWMPEHKELIRPPASSEDSPLIENVEIADLSAVYARLERTYGERGELRGLLTRSTSGEFALCDPATGKPLPNGTLVDSGVLVAVDIKPDAIRRSAKAGSEPGKTEPGNSDAGTPDASNGEPIGVLCNFELPPGAPVQRVRRFGRIDSSWRNLLERDLAPLLGRTVVVTGRPVRTGPETLGLLVGSVRTDVAMPTAHSGDRILVLKFLYEFAPPRRWDVVVFRFPGDPKENYIKRLVGLPGESIQVLGGDVFLSTDRGKTWKIARKPLDAPAVQSSLWNLVHTTDFVPNPQFDPQGRTVRIFKRWEPVEPTVGSAPAWTGLDSATFRFTANDGRSHTIRYAQYLNPRYQEGADSPNDLPTRPDGDMLGASAGKPNPSRGPEVPIFDAHSYNGNTTDGGAHYTSGVPSPLPASVDSLRIASDLRLSLDVIWHNGDGRVELTLTKHADRFTARIGSTGRVELFHTPYDQPPSDSASPLQAVEIGRLPIEQPMRLELSNADHVVELRLGGRLLIQHTYDVTPNELALLERDAPELYTERYFPRAEIAGRNADFSLRHLRLDRDIYYTQETGALRSTTHRGRGLREQPIHLALGGPNRSREFFVLGDNSGASSDSRFWDDHEAPMANEDGELILDPRQRELRDRLPKPRLRYQLGTVPEEYLTGKAFFVYWPSGHYLWGDSFPVVPRASRWRLIH